MRYRQLSFPSILFIVLFNSIIGCQSNKKNELSEKKDSVFVKKAPRISTGDSLNIKSKPFEVTYHYLALDSVLISNLKEKFTENELNSILAINRIDFEHVWRADTLVVPDTFLFDLNSYSPFPGTLSILEPVKKLILFSYPIQAFAVYENGKLIRWGPTSMGKGSTPTPTGLFFANWKAKQTVSTDNPEWKLNWYVNLDNKRGVSMHQYDLPGFPASHACMRLYEADAKWFYDYVSQWILINDYSIAAHGTPVIIFGKYAFGKRKPWLALPVDNRAETYTQEQLQDELTPFISTIQLNDATRDSLLISRADSMEYMSIVSKK